MTPSRKKWQPTDWGKFSQTPHPIEIIFKIYKEYKKIDNNTPNNPIFKHKVQI